MALIYKGIKCSICGQVINTEDRYFATSGVFLPNGHILQEYCDSAMHWKCYINWDKRKEFAFAYISEIIKYEKTNMIWAKAYVDDDFLILINPEAPNKAVRIVPISTGEFIDIKLEEWSKYLMEIKEKSFEDKYEKELFEKLIPVLIREFPNKEAILSAVDWKSKNELRERYNKDRKQAEYEARKRMLDEAKEYNDKLEMFNNRKSKCPRCKGDKIRYVDKSPENKSYFICKVCGRSFRLEDMQKGEANDSV